MASGNKQLFTRDELNKYHIPELKDHLRNLGLRVGGNKSDLITRILDHQVSDTNADILVVNEKCNSQNAYSYFSEQPCFSSSVNTCAGNMPGVRKVGQAMDSQINKLQHDISVIEQKLKASTANETVISYKPMSFTRNHLSSGPSSNNEQGSQHAIVRNDVYINQINDYSSPESPAVYSIRHSPCRNALVPGETNPNTPPALRSMAVDSITAIDLVREPEPVANRINAFDSTNTPPAHRSMAVDSITAIDLVLEPEPVANRIKAFDSRIRSTNQVGKQEREPTTLHGLTAATIYGEPMAHRIRAIDSRTGSTDPVWKQEIEPNPLHRFKAPTTLHGPKAATIYGEPVAHRIRAIDSRIGSSDPMWKQDIEPDPLHRHKPPAILHRPKAATYGEPLAHRVRAIDSRTGSADPVWKQEIEHDPPHRLKRPTVYEEPVTDRIKAIESRIRLIDPVLKREKELSLLHQFETKTVREKQRVFIPVNSVAYSGSPKDDSVAMARVIKESVSVPNETPPPNPRKMSQIDEKKPPLSPATIQHHSSAGHSVKPSQTSGIPTQAQPACTLGVMRDLITTLSDNLSMSRYPIPEPPVFDGDPMIYSNWKFAFHSMIEQRHGLSESDKLFYLRRYLKGAPLNAIEGYFSHDSANSYSEAKTLLEERYGDPFLIKDAFRKRLDSWPKLPTKNYALEIQALSDFLAKCEGAMKCTPEMSFLHDDLLIEKILNRCPDHMELKWKSVVLKSKKGGEGYPPFGRFAAFIRYQSELANLPVAAPETTKPVNNLPSRHRETPTATVLSTQTVMQRPLVCSICKEEHRVFLCRVFGDMTLESRIKAVQQHNLCHLCLNPGHGVSSCRLRKRCTTCNGSHNSLIHTESGRCGRVLADEAHTPTQQLTSQIVPVWVNSGDRKILTYAMLDSQSDSCFVTSSLVRQLQPATTDTRLRLATIADSSESKIIHCKKAHKLTITSFSDDYDHVVKLPQCFVRRSIPCQRTHIPTSQTAERWKHLSKLTHKIPSLLDCDVGLLIGYNCQTALIPISCPITGTDEEPFAVETRIGWSIIGGVSHVEMDQEFDEIGMSHRILCREVPENLQVKTKIPEYRFTSEVILSLRTGVKELQVDAEEVVRLLEGDFANDNLSEGKASQDDKLFLDILTDNITRDDQGYYVMPLPFQPTKPPLPNNRNVALGRFKGLLRKLDRNADTKILYHDFMTKLLESGEAERVPTSELSRPEVWYLPHHGVVSENKPGKIRIVFDGSCQYQGHSLNKYLLQGPDLNNSLVGVLTRFRRKPVAVSCDITKMFHMFRVSQECTDFLRFFWTDSEDSIQEYRMKVHIYGASSSPNCAKFGLQQLATDYKERSHAAERFIKEDFYVDDGLTSCEDAESAISLLKETQAMCQEGNLKLHKILSNNSKVLMSFPEDVRSTIAVNIAKDEAMDRVLGLQWLIKEDKFCFKIKVKTHTLTRRGVLSSIASIFDPLGFIAPVILVGRHILQLATDGLDWDEPLPPHIQKKWQAWLSQMETMESIQIDRCFRPLNFGVEASMELHTFGDASSVGYGACCYVRLVSPTGEYTCSLLYGKSRVSPQKRSLTIPRLELQAAVLATQIGTKMAQELSISDGTYFYSDSEIVLGYIANTKERYHAFVSNRVAEIRERTDPTHWYHVEGKVNPADHASRGVEPNLLLESNWFKGPQFLYDCETPLVQASTIELPPNDPEVRQCMTTHTTEMLSPILGHLDRFSTWEAAVRFAAMIYITVIKRWKEPRNIENTLAAEQWVMRLIQQTYLKEEYDLLSTGSMVSKNSQLWKLDPFIDAVGVIRVGGRLKHSSLLENEKHPVILPGKCHAVTLLIRHCHATVGHQGRGYTVSEIRRRGFWILNVSRLTASLIHFCVICRQLRRPNECQKMSDLPIDRTEEQPPFSYVGCDVFGPFQVKDGRKATKRYGLIFTCMASRAVHLELLDDMSTDCFINSLRCFFALRGDVRQIRCDKGTNFVGADNELTRAMEEVVDDRLKDFLLQRRCTFKFNVPGASHMGGAWERLIRTTRSVLQGTMMQSHGRLDIYSARTVLYEVMAIVNSRPLTTTIEGELEPLTPNMLLHMKSGIVLPPPGRFESSDVYSRKRWRRVQGLVEMFWSRWKSEYLSTLQVRQKWQGQTRGVKKGDIVLIKEGAFRTEWRMALVLKEIPSQDGLVRKVQLRTKDSTRPLERPITKLVVLVESDRKY